jgi:glutamate dehydrogenase
MAAQRAFEDAGPDEQQRGTAVQPLLVRYFPKQLQQKYGELIAQHPLADEITATVLTNLAVNRLGILAIPRLMGDFDASAADVMRGLSVVVDLSGMDRLWVQLDEMADSLSHLAVMAVSERLKLVTGILAAWVLRHGQPVDVEAWRKSLREPCRKIIDLLPKALKGRPEMAKWADEWQTMGLPEAMATRMALLSPLVIAPDVAMVAVHGKRPLAEVLAVHLKLGELLRLPALVRKVRAMAVPDGWTRQAVQAMGQELFTRQRRLTEYLLKTGVSAEEWMSQNDGVAQRYYSLVKEILQERHLSVAMLSVLLGRLRELER